MLFIVTGSSRQAGMALGWPGSVTLLLCVSVATLPPGPVAAAAAQGTAAWLEATESGREVGGESQGPGTSPPPDLSLNPEASVSRDPSVSPDETAPTDVDLNRADSPPSGPALAPEASTPAGPTWHPGDPSSSPPWTMLGSPRAAASSLPQPIMDVKNICVCNLLVGQCDPNCCCDPDCSASDFSVFSTCSIPIVSGDNRLCSQTVALYSMNTTKAIPERVVQYVEQVNSNVFCIYNTNYQSSLSFTSPEVPTEGNFDSLVSQFKKMSFSAETGRMSVTEQADRYEYGVPIQTTQSLLAFPAPLVSTQCTDQNPAGFLLNQDVTCSRNIQVENCNISALTLSTYSNISLLQLQYHSSPQADIKGSVLDSTMQLFCPIFAEGVEVPNSSQTVPVTVQSITMTSLDGTFNTVNVAFPDPEYNVTTGVCKNIVLEVTYVITYTEDGLITKASVSFVLGAINSSMVPVQQTFQIRFIQQNTNPVPLSGNPGYVTGQTVVAGFKPAGSGIVQSTNRYGQLTILQSSANQDCLAVEGHRVPVRFGYNMVSGCKLRQPAINCQPLLAATILNVLRGQNFPEYVASFGNSQTQNVADWVPISQTNTRQDACQVPVAMEIIVKWKKYGSLVNPQAKIDSVTQKTTYSSLQAGNGSIYQISSLVTFVDISAPADPGYKAPPTIDAKLPFDFFYPFV